MNRLELWGHQARVVIELDIGGGRKVSVPITDECAFRPHVSGGGTLTIAVLGKVQTRVIGTLKDVAFQGLDR